MQKADLPRWKSCVASGLPSPEKELEYWQKEAEGCEATSKGAF